MERRNFVKNIGAGALLLGMGGISFALGKKEIPAKL